jgi:hypothetical protein
MNERRVYKVEMTGSVGYEEPYAAVVVAKDDDEAKELADLRPGIPIRSLAIGRSAAEESYVVLIARSGS